MRYDACLDVSLAVTSVCVVDEEGKILREAKVASEPEALTIWLGALGLRLTRVGLETGALAGWLCVKMTELAVLNVVCVDARHARAAMGAMTHKPDRNDARGRAEMLRTGWFRQDHVKARRTMPRLQPQHRHLEGHKDRGRVRSASSGRPHGDGQEMKPE